MKNKIYFIIILGLFAALLHNGCEKEETKGNKELSGFIYFANTTIPVSGVLLTLDGISTVSDSNGRYRLSGIRDDKQTLKATKDGFDNYSIDLQIANGSNDYNVEMSSYLFTHKVHGIVNVMDRPLEFCEIVVLNPDGSESNLKTHTSSTGHFIIPQVPQGKRMMKLKHNDYVLPSTEIYVLDSEDELSISMASILPSVKTESIEVYYQCVDWEMTILDEGNSPVITSGVCWSTSENPTISDNKFTDSTGIESYISRPCGLLPGTTYYLRPFATNSEGTSYGDQFVFTTKDFPEVGDSYGGGTLAYILQPGDPGFDPQKIHGLIAAPGDQGVAQWGCYGSTLEDTSTDLGSGAENTRKIIASCNQDGIAARICDELVLDGYTDWYLPSIDELHKLFLHRLTIGNFTIEYYWSSSAASSFNAWPHSFCSGSRSSYERIMIKRVRAVRSF